MGKLVCLDKETRDQSNIDAAIILVKTKYSLVLNEFFNVGINDEVFNIKMEEDMHGPKRIEEPRRKRNGNIMNVETSSDEEEHESEDGEMVGESEMSHALDVTIPGPEELEKEGGRDIEKEVLEDVKGDECMGRRKEEALIDGKEIIFNANSEKGFNEGRVRKREMLNENKEKENNNAILLERNQGGGTPILECSDPIFSMGPCVNFGPGPDWDRRKKKNPLRLS